MFNRVILTKNSNNRFCSANSNFKTIKYIYKISCQNINPGCVNTKYVKRNYSLLSYYKHKKLIGVKKKFKRKNHQKNIHIKYTALENSLLLPDGKGKFPISNLVTHFSFSSEREKKTFLFPKKPFLHEKEKEVSWCSPKVGINIAFNPI